MKRAYLLVEGETDAAFLRRILPGEALDEVEFVVAKTGMSTLASTLLARRRKPVALLMDSDTINIDLAEERRQLAEEVIRLGNASTPLKVVSVVPEIEVWFFSAPEVIERVLGQSVTPEWLRLGRRDPKGILEHLAERSHKKWSIMEAIAVLDACDVERIRAIPEVAGLISFLDEVQRGDRAA